MLDAHHVSPCWVWMQKCTPVLNPVPERLCLENISPTNLHNPATVLNVEERVRGEFQKKKEGIVQTQCWLSPCLSMAAAKFTYISTSQISVSLLGENRWAWSNLALCVGGRDRHMTTLTKTWSFGGTIFSRTDCLCLSWTQGFLEFGIFHMLRCKTRTVLSKPGWVGHVKFDQWKRGYYIT